MARPAVKPYVPDIALYPMIAVLPREIRLGFEYEKACAAGPPVRTKEYLSLGKEVALDVPRLLAAAALRHFGTPYYGGNNWVAMAKESMLWSGWLGTRTDGRLLVESGHNSGRLGELASSLGEAVALDLAVSLFGAPLSLWRRIPESGPEGMDFKATTVSGDIAIEAKGAHGSAVAAKKKEIVEQKGRQLAPQKYGFVLCYQMAGRPELRQKGSYVKVVDPPSDPSSASPSMHAALREHYYQVAAAVGLDWLAQFLRAGSDGCPGSQQLRAFAVKMLSAHNPVVRVADEVYLGRYFDVVELLWGSRLRIPASGPRPYLFFGIARSVARDLVEGAPADLDLLLRRTSSEFYEFDNPSSGNYGPVRHTGGQDGVLRVDLVSNEQVLHEELNLSAVKRAPREDK